MSDAQMRVFELFESYMEYGKENGYTDFRIWCEDNIDTVAQDALVQDIYQEVNYIADKLFE